MADWKLRVGRFLFKHRSFTPIPVMIFIFIIFKPVNLERQNIIIDVTGLLISLLGEMIRVISIGYAHSGTSGRESYLRAESLNVTGIYSIARNPLYIGNFLMFSGLVAVFSNIYAILIFGLFLIFQYYFIILAEEYFLRESYGKDYETYCTLARRIIPTFKHYKKNRNSFNLKKVIYKENDSVFNMLMMYLFILLYKERFFTGNIGSPFYYIIAGVVLILCYIMIKVLKKRK